MSQFNLQTETQHAAEFIISEANGHRSRAQGWFQDPITVLVAQPCKLAAAATSDLPNRYAPVVALGADCDAIAIYGGVSSSGYDLFLAILVRDAEVNKNLIKWPTNMVQGERTAGIARFATQGIIFR